MSGGEILCNEVLLVAAPGAGEDVLMAAGTIEGTLVGLLANSEANVWQVRIPCKGAQGVYDAIDRLIQQPGVISAEPNGISVASGVTASDPLFSMQDGLPVIEADKAWALTRGTVFPEQNVPCSRPSNSLRVSSPPASTRR